MYHVTARGNGRQTIFEDDHDRRAFLALLRRVIDRFGWRCLTYCLMDNHVHLLLRTPEPNLSRGMQQLKSAHAQAFNRRHQRVGHLFAGRYGAQLVQQDAHLLEVFRYVALNPVRAGMCVNASVWPWSAHAALAGFAAAPAFLHTEEAWSWFAPAGPGSIAPQRYLAFVEAKGDEEHRADVVAVGDEAFLRAMLPATRPSTEVPVRQWGEGRPPLTELLDELGTAGGIARAYRQHGYTLSTIASHLGCHVSTVSRRLRAHERASLDCKI